MKEVYLSFEEVVQSYPISGGTLRRLLLSRESNGLNKAIIKMNRKLIFKKSLWEQFLEGFSEAPSPSKPKRLPTQTKPKSNDFSQARKWQ